MASGQIIRSIKQQSLRCCCSYRNINPSNFDFPQCFIYIFEAFHTAAGVTAITMPLGPRAGIGTGTGGPRLNFDMLVSFFMPRLLLRAITYILLCLPSVSPIDTEATREKSDFFYFVQLI